MKFEFDDSAQGWFKSSLYLVWLGISAVLRYLNIDQVMMVALTITMAFDYFTGIIRAHRFREYTYRESWLGLLDKVVMLIVPLIIALIFKAFGIKIAFTVEVLFGLLTFSELNSAIANITETRTGKRIQKYDFITAIFGYIRKAIGSIIKKQVGDEKNNS